MEKVPNFKDPYTMNNELMTAEEDIKPSSVPDCKYKLPMESDSDYVERMKVLGVTCKDCDVFQRIPCVMVDWETRVPESEICICFEWEGSE